jgi:flagellar basal-body rod protein FlgF
MENGLYTGLTRQSGLAAEMRVIAHNIANASTTGFRREGVAFTEHVAALGRAPSLSMGTASARFIDPGQGDMSQTGGVFDLAIEGEGWFLIETPQGQRLTRAGHFTPNDAGELVTPDGHRLLDAGGAPVFVPVDAGPVAIGADGTVSVGGAAIGQVGLWQPADPLTLSREAGTLFSADAAEPAENPGRLRQGFLEGANIDPVAEIARMIEVSRAYELGQGLMDREDKRIRLTIELLVR